MTTTFRIDDGLKTECDAILDSIGLNMSCAITIFLKELARRRAMPFELRADSSLGCNCNQSNGEEDRIVNRLSELLSKCAKPDWDGNGALPMKAEAYAAGKDFASRLPRDLLWGDIDVDADGDVCFEWFKAKDRQCSLTFTGDGRVFSLIKNGDSKMTATFVSLSNLKLIELVRGVFNG